VFAYFNLITSLAALALDRLAGALSSGDEAGLRASHDGVGGSRHSRLPLVDAGEAWHLTLLPTPTNICNTRRHVDIAVLLQHPSSASSR